MIYYIVGTVHRRHISKMYLERRIVQMQGYPAISTYRRRVLLFVQQPNGREECKVGTYTYPTDYN